MKAEKCLKPEEFARLLTTVRCILLLPAGAGLRVGETVLAKPRPPPDLDELTSI